MEPNAKLYPSNDAISLFYADRRGRDSLRSTIFGAIVRIEECLYIEEYLYIDI